MTRPSITTPLSPEQAGLLETAVRLLAMHKADDYYAYERECVWHIGLGNYASLIVDSSGQTATTIIKGTEQSVSVKDTPLADFARPFVSDGSMTGGKIFGHVGFNYAAHTRGLPYTPGKWPLLSLMIPRTEITLHDDHAVVTGFDDTTVRAVSDLLKDTEVYTSAAPDAINTMENAHEYIDRVSQALIDINKGRYTKVIPSRAVSLQQKVDMPATLLQGRRRNNPKRTFSLNHSGFQATGFSPELVCSVKEGKVETEPLAGTRSRTDPNQSEKSLREELLNDPKEIVEHVISVREAIDELNRLCPEKSVVVEDLMSVRPRGSVQHLGSTVSGQLDADKDGWDALDVLFPSITASGIPKQAALEGIQRLEQQPRELYAGAVLLLDGKSLFEAALVLRTVFQDEDRQWVQAGAGVIAQSNPERELTETCEKLASIAPFVVAEAEH